MTVFLMGPTLGSLIIGMGLKYIPKDLSLQEAISSCNFVNLKFKLYLSVKLAIGECAKAIAHLLGDLMLLGYNFLENILASKGMEPKDLAEKLNIAVQNFTVWKSKNQIPRRKVGEISELFSLSSSEIDQLLGKIPMRFCFRTREGGTKTEIDVSDRMKSGVEIVYESFFGQEDVSLKYDLTNLKKAIRENSASFKHVADCIRKEFTIPSYRPISYDSLVGIQDRISLLAFYLPFRAIGLNFEGESDQTAVLFTKDGSSSILVDSDRTVDEAHFDKLHEVVHVFIEGVISDSPETEKFIDKVCGELVYPEEYIVNKFFQNDASSKPIKNPEYLKETFFAEAANLSSVISPKGLARAMRDSELATEKSELFKFLFVDLHDQYRKHAVTYSEIGEMNINFRDRDELLKFYKDHVPSKGILRYPLFEKIKKDLMADAISTNDFANIFGLKLSDAIIIKAVWSKESPRDIS
jgi:hypothetical protein